MALNKKTQSFLPLAVIILAVVAILGVLTLSEGSLDIRDKAAQNNSLDPYWTVDCTQGNGSFYDCSSANLCGVSMAGIGLRGYVFDNAQVCDVDARGANFSGSSWINANVTDTDFRGASIAGSDFTGSNVTQAQLDSMSTCRNATLPAGLVCNK